ncbi:DUF4920 domain-containing protein [Gilvibacter sp.]|uniref:DUF4920 domain-containing protein n=1 Tax=Gilvibacter sp. TaxID=2729997 RepID=UPI003F4A0A4E
MRNLFVLLVLAAALVGCKSEVSQEDATIAVEEVKESFQNFGAPVAVSEVMTPDALAEFTKTLKVGDTVPVKFSSKVNSVCQKKGCWMKVDIDGEESMVRFKDYAFFMPKDIAGQDAIIEGVAFIEEVSVEDLKHYAEDDGKSPEEIAAITEPKQSLAIVSSGVLLPEAQVEEEEDSNPQE